MLRINGEVITFMDDCDFNSKEEFMDKLRAMRKSPNLAKNCNYKEFYDMVGVAIQQAFYINEKQLMRYKEYCNSRSMTGATNGKQTN